MKYKIVALLVIFMLLFGAVGCEEPDDAEGAFEEAFPGNGFVLLALVAVLFIVRRRLAAARV